MRQAGLIEDFSKGLDLVSSLSAVPAGFTPNAMNFRIAEYGGIEKILGYAAFADLGSGVSAHELFYFQKRDNSTQRLIAASSTKWQHIQSDGTVTDFRTGMNATTETTFVSYEDVLYGVDAANDMHSWAGTGNSAAVTGSPPRGIFLGVWQNKLWVAEASSGAIKMKIRWCDAGDPTSWPAANNVSLGGPGVSDRIIGGMPSPAGLLVFTANAIFVIHDQATGANRIVDAQRGCTSRKSLALVEGTVYGMSRFGVFTLELGNPPMRIVTGRVEPLFLSESPTLSNAAGVNWFDSYLCSYQRSGSANNLTLDMAPKLGSIMANQYPAHCWARGPISGADERAFFIDASDKRYVRRAFSGGSFAGTGITCYYELPPDPMGDERVLKRVHRCRVVGRGNIQIGIKTEYDSLLRSSGAPGFPGISGGVWDTAVWNTGVWGGYELYEGTVRIPARGRRVQLRVQESSSDTYPARDNMGIAGSQALGAAGVYLLEPQFTASTRTR